MGNGHMGNGHMGNGHMGNGHMGTLFLKIVLQTNMQPASIAFAAGGRSIDPLAAQASFATAVRRPGHDAVPSPQEAQDVCAPQSRRAGASRRRT